MSVAIATVCRCGTEMDLMAPGVLICPHCDRACYRSSQGRRCELCKRLDEPEQK